MQAWNICSAPRLDAPAPASEYRIKMRFPDTSIGSDVGENSVIDLHDRGGAYERKPSRNAGDLYEKSV